MKSPMKILMLDDNPDDAAIIKRVLINSKNPHEFKLVSNEDDYLQALDDYDPDIILSDNTMPCYSGTQALLISRNRQKPIPFILVTGTVSEEFAVSIIKQGADDYILKDRLTRLPAAIENALKQNQVNREKNETLSALFQSEKKYHDLFDKNPMPMWVLDEENFRFLDVNKAAIMHYGYSREEFFQMSLLDIRPDDEKERFIDFIEESKDGRVHAGMWKHLKSDGTMIWVEITLDQISFNNRPARLVLINDISEQLLAQHKIKESETNLKAIFDNSSDGFILLDNNLIIKAFNEKVKEFANENRLSEITIGESIIKYIDPSQVDDTVMVLQKAIKGEAVKINMSFEDAFGKTSWVEFSITTVWDRDQPNGLCVAGREVTERKNAEQQLLYNQSRLKQAQSLAKLGSWEMNFITGEAIWSEEACQIFGVATSDINQKYEYWKTFVHPDDREFVNQAIKDAEFSGSQSSIEYRIINNLGAIKYIYAERCVEFNSAGKPIGMYGVVQDITERKTAEKTIVESERKYRQLFERNLAGVYQTNIEGTIINCNDAFAGMIGYASSEDLIGKNADLMYFKKTDRKKFIGKLQKDGFLKNFESVLKHKDNHEVYIIENIVLQQSPISKESIIEGVMLDITVSKMAERKLEKSYQANRQLTERLSGILNTVPAHIALLNEECVIIEVNDTWKSFTSENGFVGSDFIQGDNFIKAVLAARLINRADAHAIALGIKHVFSKKVDSFMYEYACHIAGQKQWFQMQANPMQKKKFSGVVVMHINITERKLAEESIRKSNEQYELIAKATNDAVWDWDMSGHTVIGNERLFQLYGKVRGEEQITDEDFFTRLHPDDKERISTRLFEAVANSEDNITEEFRFRTSNGEYITVLDRAYVLYDAHGKATRMLGAMLDISDIRHAEEELRKSNERFDTISRATNDALWDWDLVTDEVWWNESFYKLLGYDPAGEVPAFHDWTQKIYYEDYDKVITRLKQIRKNEVDSWNDEFRFVNEDGSVITVLDRAYILKDENGQPIRVIGAFVDITQQKIHQKEIADYKNALDQSSIISITDAEGFITQVNENFCRISQYKQSELVGQTHVIINSGLHSKEFFINLWQTISSGKIWRGEFRNKAKDGSFYWVDATIVPFLDDKGRPVQYVAIRNDITQKKLLEKKVLDQTIEEQRKISRAIISAQERERNHIGQELHDNINQILAGTKMYLSMAGNEHPEIKPMIAYPMELIESSIQEIRMLSSRHVTPQKNINLEEMVQILLKNFNQHTSIASEFKIGEGDYDEISDDLKLNIYRIIQEHLNNIIKHAKATRVYVNIDLLNNAIHLNIKDNGKGFDMMQQRNGIGISNMINRIHSFNGEIVINSSPGEGCDTNIKIPY